MKIFIGSDHAGYEMKEAIRKFLADKDFDVTDCGTTSLESTDYPDYAGAVAGKTVSREGARGILVCGTGIGMSMTANKVKGIRAAVVHDEFTAEASRRHNDANVLCLGERVIDNDTAKRLVEIFLVTQFEGGRHARRVQKINDYD